MWESQRDFQRVGEGWKAGFLAFHAFHTLSFPWPALKARIAKSPRRSAFGNRNRLSEMPPIRPDAWSIAIAGECIRDLALIHIPSINQSCAPVSSVAMTQFSLF
jgi:hypothetical protein